MGYTINGWFNKISVFVWILLNIDKSYIYIHMSPWRSFIGTLVLVLFFSVEWLQLIWPPNVISSTSTFKGVALIWREGTEIITLNVHHIICLIESLLQQSLSAAIHSIPVQILPISLSAHFARSLSKREDIIHVYNVFSHWLGTCSGGWGY